MTYGGLFDFAQPEKSATSPAAPKASRGRVGQFNRIYQTVVSTPQICVDHGGVIPGGAPIFVELWVTNGALHEVHCCIACRAQFVRGKR